MKSIKLAFVALLLLSPLAQAQKIAVVDPLMAIQESDAAKKYAKEAEKLFAPKIKQLKTLQDEIKGLEQKLQKDGPTLTESQRESRQLEIKRKFEDLQLQDRQLRSEKARSDQAELGKMRPKLEKALDEVSKELNYDMVLERGAVPYLKPEFDITRKVIERMNKLK
ncbi:OmpH family outer membrane protein [Endozoicomonas sp. 4G]|uniref:OmpH family outer membrane protein n=1 Tax=Endozoicomonas sp. 4G TaxID=2872754 RepID=UPI002078AFB2|nr:OmpH family outer membrane protein [Endozoicomonas sp. 4G]